MKQLRVLVPLVGVVLALGLSGCASAAQASSGSTVSPAHPIKPQIPSVVAIARAQAMDLLATATLPSNAIASSAAPESTPSAPLDSIACKPAVDVTSYALLRNVSLKQAQSEVAATVPGGNADTGYTARNGRWQTAGVSEQASNPRSELVVTMASTPGGDVAVRVDAIMAERGAVCVRHGIPVQPSSSPSPTPAS